MERFVGRVAVVTGGANGIGYALAERFLREGMKVVLADINPCDLDRAVEDLSAQGEVIGQQTDVADPASIQALADTAMSRFGAVHVLCNNAGVGGLQRFSSTSEATWNWILGVDLWGVIHGCRLFLPILEQQDEAHILNTGSVLAFCYGPYRHPYNVAKAGVVALTEGLYRELRYEKPNLGISVLCPSFTKTAIDDDERNAPEGHVPRSLTDPDLEPLRKRASLWLSRGKEASEIADIAFEGIRNRKLHIFPQEEWLEALRARMDNILAGRPVTDEPISVLAPVALAR